MASRNPVIIEIEKIYDYLSSKSDPIANLMKSQPDWEYMLIVKIQIILYVKNGFIK